MDSLKIRFPKETLKSLRDAYDSKEEFHNDRLEFLLKKDREGLAQAQGSDSFRADKLIDYRYRGLLNFASFSSRSGLINKFRSVPDLLLNLRDGKSPSELEEKKEFFKDYTRNLTNIRQITLQE